MGAQLLLISTCKAHTHALSHALFLTGNILLKLRGVKAVGGGEDSVLKAQNIISKRSL